MLTLPAIEVAVRHKGFPPSAVGRPAAEASGDLHDFLTPILVLKGSALEHNLMTMARFCDEHGLSLAPHVKTTMSPEIAAAQLRHGAWALTVATPSQARILRSLGVDRILLANELVDPAAIAWLGAELDADPDFCCYCYVDSFEGIEILDKELSQRQRRRMLPVIVELGVRGGRAGVRGLEEMHLIAERVATSAHLRLAGVGGFEGIIGGELDSALLTKVRAYLRRLRDAAAELSDGEEFVVTVGGSAFPELVADELGRSWQQGRPTRVVLRSGCYVTHDSLVYQRFRELIGTEQPPMPLWAGLELWSRVLSTPEPGLAILDFGRRDTGTDAGLPRPLNRIRRGSTVLEPPPVGELTALNDQHAYFRGELAVADRVGFGISHPCTTLDKWQLIPVVDDSYVLCGTVQTIF